MHLTKADINRHPGLQKQVRQLYRRAFPRQERVPWWLLRLNARRKGIDLTAFMDGEVFCGFTSSVTVEGLHFLLFFAVEESRRGMGCGSAILQNIQEEYGAVALNIETLTEGAPNYPERQRRFAFYKKNGFFDTGYHVWEVGGKFRVLSTDARLDVPGYKRIFRKLSCGLWNVRLEKAEPYEPPK